jgi:hypothetical protein
MMYVNFRSSRSTISFLPALRKSQYHNVFFFFSFGSTEKKVRKRSYNRFIQIEKLEAGYINIQMTLDNKMLPEMDKMKKF